MKHVYCGKLDTYETHPDEKCKGDHVIEEYEVHSLNELKEIRVTLQAIDKVLSNKFE